MTDIEGFLTIYGHSDNLLNNKSEYLRRFRSALEGVLPIVGYMGRLRPKGAPFLSTQFIKG